MAARKPVEWRNGSNCSKRNTRIVAILPDARAIVTSLRRVKDIPTHLLGFMV